MMKDVLILITFIEKWIYIFDFGHGYFAGFWFHLWNDSRYDYNALGTE